MSFSKSNKRNNGFNLNKNYDWSEMTAAATDVFGVFQQVVDKISALADEIENELDNPKDAAFIKTFRKRGSSIVMIMRPGILERKSGHPLVFKYTSDDFIIIEYDKITDEVVQAIPSRLDDQLRSMVDGENGLLTIED